MPVTEAFQSPLLSAAARVRADAITTNTTITPAPGPVSLETSAANAIAGIDAFLALLAGAQVPAALRSSMLDIATRFQAAVAPTAAVASLPGMPVHNAPRNHMSLAPSLLAAPPSTTTTAAQSRALPQSAIAAAEARPPTVMLVRVALPVEEIRKGRLEMAAELTPSIAKSTLMRQLHGHEVERQAAAIPPATTNAQGCWLSGCRPKTGGEHVEVRPVVPRRETRVPNGTKRQPRRNQQLLHRLAILAWQPWADFVRMMTETGAEASHLCHHGACFRPEHIVVESRPENERRKQCIRLGRCVCSNTIQYIF